MHDDRVVSLSTAWDMDIDSVQYYKKIVTNTKIKKMHMYTKVNKGGNQEKAYRTY